MKPSSDLSGAVFSGLMVSAGLALVTMPLLLSKTYEFDIAPFAQNIFDIVGIFCLMASLATIGVIPVIRNKIENYREGAASGLFSGLIAAIIVFALIGNVYSALVLGVIPFIGYLTDPGSLSNIDPINAVLRPVVKSVLSETYLILFLHLLGGAVLSVFEATVTVWIVSLRKKRIK